MMNRNRREFVAGLVAAAGSARVLAGSEMPALQRPAKVQTIQDVIDLIISEILPEPLERTIDTVKVGDPSQPIRGVASTFLPTFDVLKRAHASGANLVIPHEPTWYNHYDRVEHLQGDPVYEAKMRFLEDTGLVIWRFHDYSHRMKPDVIVRGVVRRLGYEDWVMKITRPIRMTIAFTIFRKSASKTSSRGARLNSGFPTSRWSATRARNAGASLFLPAGGAPESWMTIRSCTWSRKKPM